MTSPRNYPSPTLYRRTRAAWSTASKENPRKEAVMPFRVDPLDSSKRELVLENEPAYVRALPMAPRELETEIKTGIWLVVYFPVWSMPERISAFGAIDAVKEFRGKVNLGIRPFTEYDEVFSWWPTGKAGAMAALSSFPSIGWLIVRDGKVLYEGAGLRSVKHVKEMIENAMSVP